MSQKIIGKSQLSGKFVYYALIKFKSIKRTKEEIS